MVEKINRWLENSKDSLLPLSEEKHNFSFALKEWEFTGECIDYDTPCGICSLCLHEALRYHFEIRNIINNNSLWVGSKCISRFDITVQDEHGNEILKEEKEFYLRQLVKEKYIQKSLESLAQTRPNGKIGEHYKTNLDKYCIDTFNKYEHLNPKMLNYLFMRFEEENIKYNREYFGIDIRSKENKNMLIGLGLTQYNRIKKALSINQRKFYETHSINFVK